MVGTAPISPAPVPTITGGTPPSAQPLTADTTGLGRRHDASPTSGSIDGTPVPGRDLRDVHPDRRRRRLRRHRAGDRHPGRLQPDHRRPAPPPPSACAPRRPLATPTISGTPKIGAPAHRRPGHLAARHGLHLPVARQRHQHHRRDRPDLHAGGGHPGRPDDRRRRHGTRFGYTTTSRTSAATAAVAAGDAAPDADARRSPARPRSAWPTPRRTARGTTARRSPSSGRPTAPTSPARPPARSRRPRPSSARRSTVTVTGTKPGIAAGHPDQRRRAPPVEPGTQTLQPTPTITGTPRAGTASHRRPGHLGHRHHPDLPVVRRRRRDPRRHGHDLHADDRPDRPGADLRGHQHPRRLHHGRQDQRRQDGRWRWPRR